LERGLSELTQETGRKAVIVLSDGENYPFSVYSGMTHPEWGEDQLSPDEVVRRFREEGVTLYAVNFADRPDPNLSQMTRETGGEIFEARTASGLGDVYTMIREDIQKEARIRVKIPAAASVERNLIIRYGNEEDKGGYFAPMMLGNPSFMHWLIPLLVIAAAAAGVAGMHLFSFEKPAAEPEIQTIGEGTTVQLREEVTVIGSAPEAHLSLHGNPGIDHHHATVVHNEKRGTFTLVSERPVRVNNTPVRKRILKSGDVIGIEGTTLIFDAPGAMDGDPKQTNGEREGG
jgi:Ca-activated chloride channel family protein